MPKVGIVMGSDSDLKVMSKAAATLEKFGIDYEMTIISAHRMPDVFFDWAKAAEGKGIKVIIAGAGMAAHLPGMCAERIWRVWTHFIQSFRCHLESRLLQLQSTAV